MSELVSEGHNEAPDYPIAFVWEEVQIVADRKNRILASEATILQAAINTGISAFGKDGGKKASTHFQKLVKSLLGDDAVNDRTLPPTPAEERLKKRRERRNT